MLWGIRIAFFVLVLLFVLSVATSCVRPEVIEADTRTAAILAAQARRDQVVRDIVRLGWVLRHTGNEERRIALELALTDRRAELDRLNAIIAR
ncbi:MAG TPA: hypothetical protein VF748_17460 [Candidatus Acidoferrum sp.]